MSFDVVKEWNALDANNTFESFKALVNRIRDDEARECAKLAGDKMRKLHGWDKHGFEQAILSRISARKAGGRDD